MTVDDFKDSSGNWVKTFRADGARYTTRANNLYFGIVDRCKPGGVYQSKKPSYVGCQNLFENFNHFAEWCQRQIGYRNDGWQIDKDLLSTGVKVYSPETCVFVPRSINLLLTRNDSRKGDLPTGVVLHKNGKYIAQVSIDGKTQHLGMVETVEDAFQLYKTGKESEIRRQAERFKDQLCPKAYEALMNFTVLD